MRNGGLAYKLYHYTSWLNYIIWLFELNVLLLLLNAPLLIGILVLDIRMTTIPIMILLSFNVVPTVYAALKTLLNIRDSERVLKPFFQTLKASWWKLTRSLWFVPLLEWMILLNLHITSGNEFHFLWWPNLLLFSFGNTFLLNLIMVIGSWSLSIRQSFILTIKLAIVKSLRSNMTLIFLLSTWVILSKWPIYLFMFGLAAALQLCLVNFRPVIAYVNGRPENL